MFGDWSLEPADPVHAGPAKPKSRMPLSVLNESIKTHLANGWKRGLDHEERRHRRFSDSSTMPVKEAATCHGLPPADSPLCPEGLRRPTMPLVIGDAVSFRIGKQNQKQNDLRFD